MKYRNICAAAAATLLLSTAPGLAATLYGTNFGSADDSLFEIDTGTGVATSGGGTGSTRIGDLTSDTRAGSATIWGINLGGGPNNLLEIDPGTGVASVVATVTGAVADIVSLAFDEVTNTLYGNTSSGFGGGPDQLYTIDILTGAATSVGLIGFNNVFALSFDTSGNLFGVSNDSNELISIDTVTGVGTSIGGTGLFSTFDMAYDPDSDEMFLSAAGASELYIIDTGTGATTLVGGYANAGASNIAGLAFGSAAPVPVPASLPLLLAGLGAFGFLRRRRKA